MKWPAQRLHSQATKGFGMYEVAARLQSSGVDVIHLEGHVRTSIDEDALGLIDPLGFWRETGSFLAGNEKLLSVIIWPHFFAIQILFFILIAMYCTVHELVRVIGKEKALRIFFGPMPAPEV